MAYLPQSEKEKEEQQGQGGPTNETTLGGGPSGTIGQGSTGQASGGVQQAPGQSGTGFVNLQRYISSNQPGIGRMTDTTVGKIGETGEQARQSKENIMSTFGDQAGAGRVQTDKSLIKQLGKDPTAITKDQDTLARFQQMQSGQYGGPKSWADVDGFQDAQSNVNQLGTTLGQTETTGGRYNLLRNYLGDQRYTQGENRLDQAFMQSDPNAQQKLAGVREQYDPTVQGFGEGLSASQQQAQQFMQEAQQTNQATQQALGKARTAAEQQAAQRLAQENAARQAQVDQFMTGLTGWQSGAGQMGGFTDDGYNISQINQTLQSHGLSPIDVQAIKASNPGITDEDIAAAVSGSDPRQFVRSGPSANFGNVMSQQDFARMEALGQLAGFDVSQYSPTGPAGAAVGFNDPAYSANIGQEAAKLLAARQAQQQALAPASSGGGGGAAGTGALTWANPGNWSAGGKKLFG